MNWHEMIQWTLTGFFFGLGFNIVGTLYRLIVKG
jgi:hypothetical protein